MSLAGEIVSNRQRVVGWDIGAFFNVWERSLESRMRDTVGVGKYGTGSAERELSID
jgi:hypothetical protein